MALACELASYRKYAFGAGRVSIFSSIQGKGEALSERTLGEYLEDLTTVEGGSAWHPRESSRALWRYRLEQFAPETFHSVVADVQTLDEEELS